jgi:hypothetical protein
MPPTTQNMYWRTRLQAAVKLHQEVQVASLSHGGIVCTGETCKNVVKMTFAKGAALKDPSGLFNSILDGNVRRAIDIHEGDEVNEFGAVTSRRTILCRGSDITPSADRAASFLRQEN